MIPFRLCTCFFSMNLERLRIPTSIETDILLSVASQSPMASGIRSTFSLGR